MSRYDLDKPKKDFFERMSNGTRWSLWFAVVTTLWATTGYYVFFNDNPNGWWVTVICTTWLMVASALYMKLENVFKY